MASIGAAAAGAADAAGSAGSAAAAGAAGAPGAAGAAGVTEGAGSWGRAKQAVTAEERRMMLLRWGVMVGRVK